VTRQAQLFCSTAQTLTSGYLADVRWMEIEVADTGGARATSAGDGQGRLAGLRERLTIYGGSLRAGPAGNGYVVEARLPWSAA
jgi:hypothetical protein